MATMMSVEDVLERLKVTYPDKMLVDDIDCFTRGKLAGNIEAIEYIENLIRVDKEDEEYESRY